MTPKLMISFGTRPEAIKLAPLITHLEESMPKSFRLFVCSTGQHRDLLAPVLRLFNVVPDVDLNVFGHSSGLASMTAEIVAGVADAIGEVDPTLVLVQGDTASSFGAALAAFYNRVPVCHLEAGLRSYERCEPFPEEMNRRLIAQLASYHLAPHEAAEAALIQEGVDRSTIWIVGNILEDAFRMARTRVPSIDLPVSCEHHQRMLLVTQHRRENIEGGIRNTCEAIKQLVAVTSDLVVCFIVYPSPIIQNVVSTLLDGIERVHLLEPLPYDVFLGLLERSHVVLTDSGGVCEEAAFLGVPALMLRRATERQHLVEEGCAELVGTSVDSISDRTLNLLARLGTSRRYRKIARPEGGVSRLVSHLLVEAILPHAMGSKGSDRSTAH